MQENHEYHELRLDYKWNYLHGEAISSPKQSSCWIYVHYLFSLLASGKPAWALNMIKIKKTTYTASAVIMVDCVWWATKGQGVPLRQHGIVCTKSTSGGSIWGQVTHTQAFSRVMQEHHNGGDYN